MWFAALSTYQQAPWIIHLANKIMDNSMPVISLLDMSNYPFRHTDRITGQVRLVPPSAVRAHKYYYDFTRWVMMRRRGKEEEEQQLSLSLLGRFLFLSLLLVPLCPSIPCLTFAPIVMMMMVVMMNVNWIPS